MKKTFKINVLARAATIILLLTLTAPSATYAGEMPFFAKYPNIDRSTWYLSHGWANGSHQACEWLAGAIKGKDGNLLLTLSDKGGRKRKLGCAEIQSKKRFGYGRYETRMRAAKGSGTNTAFFTYTGPPHGVPEHDEIDFEFLGKKKDLLQLSFHRDGRRQKKKMIHLGYNASEEFHNYTFEWLPDKIIWYVDGKHVHQTEEGAEIPVNPGKIFFSLWSGTKEMDSWLGPFKYKEPLNAEVQWVKFTSFEDMQDEAENTGGK